jgi:large conductance mechanosensitive channel
MRGSLIDTAVAFVMGAAFGKIVSAFVDGIVMPMVGMLTSGKDFSTLTLVLKPEVKEIKDAAGAILTAGAAEVSIKYGTFITTIIDFTIVAFVVFMVIKAINSMKKKEEEAPAAAPEPTATEKLLAEIRDSLKK